MLNMIDTNIKAKQSNMSLNNVDGEARSIMLLVVKWGSLSCC